MSRTIVLFSTAVATVALSLPPVFADQLTLGGGGTATFTGTGSTSGDVITIATSGTPYGCASASTCIGYYTGSFESPTGTTIYSGAAWSFSVSPLLSLLAPSGSNYAVDPNGGQLSTFNFSGGGGDTVTGTIDWNSLLQSGSTLAATLNGVLKVGSVVGGGTDGANFAADFPVGSDLSINYSFPMGEALSALVGSTGAATGTASGGEVSLALAGAPSVPEPGVLVLFGTGMFLLLIDLFFRKYRRA